MNRRRLVPELTTGATFAPARIGLLVGGLWALHAAVVQIPRQGYFLVPLVAAAVFGFIVWRMVSHAGRFEVAGKGIISLGLGCWFVAATLSTLLNYQTDQVVLTYCVVFVTGALLFVALSGITLTPGQLDAAAVLLAVGALFPLVSGLFAFFSEWGTDVSTMVTAYRNVLRMSSYEAVTFGNRGNTAAFLLLVAPLLLTLALDRAKAPALRLFCSAVLSLIAVNLFILQVRAAFVPIAVILPCVWIFKCGLRRLPLLATAGVVGWVLLFNVAPDAGLTMGDQLMAAVTVDTEGDTSIQQRAEAINEGVQIAERNWLLGIGPGGALTRHSHDSAHQFQVQQAMETGILGLIGSTMFSLGIWASLLRTMQRRRNDVNDVRFALLAGPAAYVLYSVMANATLGFGSLNPWAALLASMIALVPAFTPEPAAVRRVAARRTLLSPPSAGPRSAGGRSARQQSLGCHGVPIVNYALTVYPLSKGFRRRLEGALAAEPVYLNLSEFRTLGPAKVLSKMRSLGGTRLVLPIEDENSRLILRRCSRSPPSATRSRSRFAIRI